MKDTSHIKVTSFDYAITSNIVAGMKTKENNRILTENTNAEAKRITFANIPATQSNFSRLLEITKTGEILKEQCFLNSLSKIYVESIPLDESFKEPRQEQLRLYFNKILTENIDISTFMKECKTRSKFLNNLVEACDKKSKMVKDEVYEDANLRGITPEEYIDKCMDKDDLTAIDEYDAEEVSNIIKDKVTEVIKTEQENNQKDMDMVEEITNQKALGENVAVARIGVEDYTLFKSIMINCCKQTLNETSKIDQSIPDYSVLSESGEITLNMDTMLMESVVEYTRLELFNTLKISNHSVRDMKNICNKIAYNNYCQPY